MECQWTRKICKEMEKAGALCFAIVGGKMQASGWPDRLVVTKHGVVLIEFKGVKTAVTRLQLAVHREILRRGPYVYVAREPGVLTLNGEIVGEFRTGAELLQILGTRVTN